MIQRLTSASKRRIGEQINTQLINSTVAARRLKCSDRTTRMYAWKLRNGIPIHARVGRPKALDNDHFQQLVDFARGLPRENVAQNDLLYKKYRELTRDTLIKRLQEVNGNFDPASMVVSFSRRSRRRWCLLAAASL